MRSNACRPPEIGSGGLADFFARLAEKDEDSPLIRILSTHPASAERLAHIRSAERRTGRPALTGADWANVRSACLTLQTGPTLP